jgi:hypothetical protein
MAELPSDDSSEQDYSDEDETQTQYSASDTDEDGDETEAGQDGHDDDNLMETDEGAARHKNRSRSVPEDLMQTTLCPDMVLAGLRARPLERGPIPGDQGPTSQVDVADVFIATEERLQQAAEEKEEKYNEMLEALRRKGWKVGRLVRLGMGARGGVPIALKEELARLGVKGANGRKCIREMQRKTIRGLYNMLATSRRLETSDQYKRHSRLSVWAGGNRTRRGGNPRKGEG